MKPHLWFEFGCWWCAYARDALIRWSGVAPHEAWKRRELWLSYRSGA